MKRKTIISLIFSLLAIALLSVSVYASYSFVRNIIVNEIEAGKIHYTAKEDFIMYYTPDEGYNTPNPASNYIEVPDGKLSLTGHDGFDEETNIVTCYASKKTNHDDVQNYIYLKQLGFSFRYKAEIDTMYRISVKSSWLSHKVYLNGTVVDNVITKEKRVGEQFANIPSDYYVDNDAEYIYFKNKVAMSEQYNTLELNCDNDYFYNIKVSPSYREYIIVEMTFDIDIVQANRALAKWGLSKFPWEN